MFVPTQHHLKLLSGGWVLLRGPATFEPLCKLVRSIGGGYPPPSIILNPNSVSRDDTFLPTIDYKQMNCLAMPDLADVIS